MKLTTGMRNHLPSSTFAGPDRSFPIPDLSHARNALSRAHFASNPGAIRAKVHAKFPTIGMPRLARGSLLGQMKGVA